MTEQRQILLAEFVEKALRDKGVMKASMSHLGTSMQELVRYLNEAEKLGVASYRAYIINHGLELSCKTPMHAEQSKNLILDFLNFHNYAKTRRKSKEQSKPAARLGTIGEAQRGKLNAFLSWLNGHYDYSQNTLAAYMFGMKDFFSYFQTFSEANARAYINDLEEHRGYKPATVELRTTALMMYAKSLGKSLTVKRRKSARKLDTANVPSEKEYNKLLDYLRTRDIRSYLMIKILATTGARHSELMKMSWEDVMNGEVIIKGKGSKLRRFFFTRDLAREVQACGLKGMVEESRIRPGNVRSDRCLGSQMKAWADACGIDRAKMHPHAFRHFFAKMYLKNNKDVVQLAELLGHGSVDTTRIYLQKTKDEQQREFNKVVSW